MAQCGIKKRTRRGGMRNSDGIETVRSHLGKVSLNPLMILVLPSLFIWSECSVSHAFNVELLIALKEELSPHFKPNGYRAGFGSRHECRNSDACFGFQHASLIFLRFAMSKDPGRFAASELKGPSYASYNTLGGAALADATFIAALLACSPRCGDGLRSVFWCHCQAVRYLRTFLPMDVSEGRTQHESTSPQAGIRSSSTIGL